MHKKHKPAKLECAAHLTAFLQPSKLGKRIRQCAAALEKYEFDTIAVRGVSGLLLGPGVAMVMGKSLIVVRKHEEDRHSPHICEGDRGTKRYVIVDDFMDTGATVEAIIHDVKKWQQERGSEVGECIGVLEASHISHKDKLDYCRSTARLNTDRLDGVD